MEMLASIKSAAPVLFCSHAASAVSPTNVWKLYGRARAVKIQ